MKMTILYDTEELEVLNGIEKWEYVSSKDGNTFIEKLKEDLQAKHTKRRSISIRPLEYDIEKIKIKAMEEWIPYQTLMNSILHKYATGKLIEK